MQMRAGEPVTENNGLAAPLRSNYFLLPYVEVDATWKSTLGLWLMKFHGMDQEKGHSNTLGSASQQNLVAFSYGDLGSFYSLLILLC